MKHCFTYCALFPKGFQFDIHHLVRLWVAQGYTESEDKGLDCFKTLWWRSFFQEVNMDALGNMSTCRMHDLMHDLADSIAGEKIIRTSSSNVLKNIPSKTRHLAISRGGQDDPSEEDYSNGLANANKVRTLICLKPLSNEEFEQVLSNFSRLRVLINLRIDSTLLNSIDELKQLRYLGFEQPGRQKQLPDSITNLVNLQALGLNGYPSPEELPRNVKKLVDLKLLDLRPISLSIPYKYPPRELPYSPKRVGELKFLERLPFFAVGKSSNGEKFGARLDELKGLNALRGELTITNLGNAEDAMRNDVYVLKEKRYLQSLLLDWRRDGDVGDDATLLSTHDDGILEMLWAHPNLKKLVMYHGYQGVRLPDWFSGLTNLVELLLQDCRQCEYLPPQLHRMSSLKKLTIKNCPLLEGTVNNDQGDHCDSSQFHRLSDLCISNCPMLTRLPTFPTIEGELELENASLAPFARTMKMKMRGPPPPSSSSSSALIIHPLSKLIKLILTDIDDDLELLAHYDSSSCLVSLLELQVSGCNRGGVKLPGSLCSSIYLTEIYLSFCKNVEYLPPLHELPSLKELTIVTCPKLEGCWWKGKGKDDDHYHNFNPSVVEEDEGIEDEWPHFPNLTTLKIEKCRKLTRMPLFPTVDELMLSGTSSEALTRTMKMKPVLASLSKLTILSLAFMDDLESLPEEGLHNLTSLELLETSFCPRLASLPPAMRDLASLQSLCIARCPLLTERCREGDGEDWPNISHIPYIRIDGICYQ